MQSTLRRLLLAILAILTLTPLTRAQFVDLAWSKKKGIAVHVSSRPMPRTWVPGHYEVRTERKWVEGPEQRVYVMPIRETRYDACGRAYEVELRSGYWMLVREPGRFVESKVQTWVPGHWRHC